MGHATRGAYSVHQWRTILFEKREFLFEEYERRGLSKFECVLVSNHKTDYAGISASRLEVLEERLRDDVVAELNTFGGR